MKVFRNGRLIRYFLVIFSLFFLKGALSYAQGKVCFHEKCVEVEIATTPEELTQGLQKRVSLAEHGGMLFTFPESGVYRFWMKDTLFALDMVWLDENKKVIYIEKNVLPCEGQSWCPVYGPNKEARHVLEVSAGLSKEFNIQIDDQAEF